MQSSSPELAHWQARPAARAAASATGDGALDDTAWSSGQSAVRLAGRPAMMQRRAARGLANARPGRRLFRAPVAAGWRGTPP